MFQDKLYFHFSTSCTEHSGFYDDVRISLTFFYMEQSTVRHRFAFEGTSHKQNERMHICRVAWHLFYKFIFLYQILCSFGMLIVINQYSIIECIHDRLDQHTFLAVMYTSFHIPQFQTMHKRKINFQVLQF